jgi:subtilisin family serine protease
MKGILLTFYVCVTCLSVLLSGTSFASSTNVTELIVRFQVGVTESPDEIIKSINNAQKPRLKERLNYPVKARRLLSHSRKLTSKSSNNPLITRNPLAEQLEEYIVLSYPSRQALEKAKKALQNNPDVLWIGENTRVSLSAAPSDTHYPYPLVSVSPGPNDNSYQWSMHALNMSEVWDFSRGHAYLAMIDRSIDTTHPDLHANFRSRFSTDLAYGNDSVDTWDPNDQNSDNNNLSSLDLERVGHGTHVAGILAAGSDNGTGVTGVCWHCSLMVGKTGYVTQGSGWLEWMGVFEGSRINTELARGDVINGIYYMVETGAQVINLSLYAPEPDAGSCKNYASRNDPFCQVLSLADEMDVVIVAAAGNEGWKAGNDNGNVDFPAKDHRVIAVGAVDSAGTVPPWSNKGPEIDLVAPGVDILSTFNTNMDWILEYPDDLNIPFAPNCGDSVSAPTSYGPCSGTSMSTPHVSGIAAILRSTNPLLNKWQIKELLTSKARRAGNPDNAYGHGLPDPLASVKAVLGTVNGVTLKNRLTPLFSLYSSTAQDHFYTTVPQMAMAALYEHLQPQPLDGEVKWRSIGGSRTPGYYAFPRFSWMPSEPPMASVYIFTTHNNPVDPSNELVPLYRLSYQGTDNSNTNHQNVDHTYATEEREIKLFELSRYEIDGIEGYIYPRTSPQPEGTVRLYRKYNWLRDDHAIFPETELASMTAQGYSQNSGNDWIGYVYLNQDSDGDGLIDGFEAVIGTDSTNPDSDSDGLRDGHEVNLYHYYSDPLDPSDPPG